MPHNGHTLISLTSLFISTHLHALVIGRRQYSLVEEEGVVPLEAGSHVAAAGDADGPVLVHNVDEGSHRPAPSRSDALVLHPQFLLVVKGRESLVSVQRLFIRFRHLPDDRGNGAAIAFLDGEVGAGLAALEKQLPAGQVRRAEYRRPWAAPAHLRYVQVAAVGYVVSFCHFVYHPFRRLTLLPPKARRSGSGRRRLSPLCPSSGASVAEGRVAGEVACQEIPRGGEFLSDESQPHQPGAHRKLGVLGLLGLGACGLDFLRHLAQCEAKLNVALQLAGVDTVLPPAVGRVELEKPELDGTLGEGRVVIEHFMWR